LDPKDACWVDFCSITVLQFAKKIQIQILYCSLNSHYPGTAGFTFTSCKPTAFLKLRPLQSSIENKQLSTVNEKSEAQKSYLDTLLRLSAVVNEGKGAAEYRSLPGRKMLDKAEAISIRSLICSLPEKSPYEPDFMTADRPVAQTHRR
jgi:hypothetical protein